jgi:F-type H+-transporting ATPase subunit b
MINSLARIRGCLPVATVALLLPQLAQASEGGEDKWGSLLIAGKFFNLAVVIAVLVWVARKPLANFYASRTAAIREQLEEAQTARLEAEAKLAEMQARMGRLDDELKQIRATGEAEGQEDYRRLLSEAEADSAKIVDRARQEIHGMTRAAEIELKGYAADLAVKLAEDRIRGEMTDEDRGRLFATFVTKLGDKG